MLSSERDFNTIKEMLKSKDFVKEHLSAYYGGVTIMSTNSCNANCVFCAYQHNKDEKSVMSFDIFAKAFHDISELGFLGTMVFTPVSGEPLLDKGLFDKISFAVSQGVTYIYLTTNGIALGQNENYKKVIDSGVTHLFISTPGFNKEAYVRLFRKNKYEEMFTGLLKTLDYASANSSQKVEISIGVYLDRDRKEMFSDEDWGKVEPYVSSGVAKLCIGEEFDDWSGVIEKDSLPDGMKLIQSSNSSSSLPCVRLLRDLAILPDGQVRVCSCRYLGTIHDELVIGDLRESSLKDIYFNSYHLDLIEKVAKGFWPEVCLKCSQYFPITFSEDELKLYHKVVKGKF